MKVQYVQYIASPKKISLLFITHSPILLGLIIKKKKKEKYGRSAESNDSTNNI